MSATSKPKLYNPRHPERTLLYQTVAEHYETWLELASAGQFDGQGDHHTPKPFVRKAFAKYLECSIFACVFRTNVTGDFGIVTEDSVIVPIFSVHRDRPFRQCDRSFRLIVTAVSVHVFVGSEAWRC